MKLNEYMRYRSATDHNYNYDQMIKYEKAYTNKLIKNVVPSFKRSFKGVIDSDSLDSSDDYHGILEMRTEYFSSLCKLYKMSDLEDVNDFQCKNTDSKELSHLKYMQYKIAKYIHYNLIDPEEETFINNNELEESITTINE